MSDKVNGLITCDLVCLGVPSPKGFRSYVDWLEACTGKHVVGYRHRGHTPWGLYEERAVYDDGTFEEATVRTRAWKRVWNKMMLRPSCLACSYHSIIRPGDLSMGDYWGIERAHPGIADDTGVSCLFANTAHGLRFLKGAAHSLNLVASAPSLCANPEQPMLLHPPRASRLHDGFWESLVRDGFGAACKNVGALGAKRSLKDAAHLVFHTGGKGAERDRRESVGMDASIDLDRVQEEEFPLVFAAKHRSDEVREKSSSGGMFYALADYMIGQGGVVYGCAFDDGLEARHIRCETLEECERCMGSKYSQSDMGSTIAMVSADLSSGRPVLFTGTPCQVDAVRHACGEMGGGLLTADLICHGVPSPGLFAAHLRFLERRLGCKVVAYNHRPKNRGWGHCEAVACDDGSVHQGSRMVESWKRLFYGNRMLRPSCYACPYTTSNRSSDVTIADFWGIERTRIAAFSDDLGVSLVLANTPKGLDAAKRCDIDARRSSLEEALPGNPMLSRPTSCTQPREPVWEALCSDGYDGMMKRFRFLPTRVRFAGDRFKRFLHRL